MKKLNKSIRMTIFMVAIMALVILILVLTDISKPRTFEDKREKLLTDLYSNIAEATQEGRYQCCIEPVCTMCYLGNWMWEDGSCYCDELIMEGRFDEVCPQCKKGIEEGRCISTQQELCEV